MLQATAKVLLFKNRKLKNGGFPVVLQLVHQEKPKRITLGKHLWCFEQDWDVATSRFKRAVEQYREKNAYLDHVRARTNEIFFELEREGLPFSFEEFEKRFVGEEPLEAMPIGKLVTQLVEEMKQKGRLGNARVYRDFGVALNNFKKVSKTKFTDVTYSFLKNFEQHLYQRGCTGGGIHNYMRTLRAIYNEAIKRELVSRDAYPFKSQLNPSGYSLANLKSVAVPRALNLDDIEKIKAFDVEKHPSLNLPWKIFMFTYYAYGINFADLILLKTSNIRNGRIMYRRAKTGKEYAVAISAPMQAILDEFKRPESEYLFPILTEGQHQTLQQIQNRKHKVLSQINNGLKEIAGILGIDASLTTYVARHTFATTLKDKGVNIALISESLGHSDLSTTKAYLRQFEQGKFDALGELL